MSLARRPFRAINARTVELAGTNQFQMFATVNTKKFPRGILDQVISLKAHDGECERAPGPGLMKSQATSKSQAASYKQVSSFRTNLVN